MADFRAKAGKPVWDEIADNIKKVREAQELLTLLTTAAGPEEVPDTTDLR